MEEIINVHNYIQNGFSNDDAELLRPHVLKALKSKGLVILDFNRVEFYTTLFFSQALTYLLEEMGENEYKKRIKVINLSESGESTYNHALEYALEYYGKTEEERRMIDELFYQSFDDM